MVVHKIQEKVKFTTDRANDVFQGLLLEMTADLASLRHLFSIKEMSIVEIELRLSSKYIEWMSMIMDTVERVDVSERIFRATIAIVAHAASEEKG